MCEFVNKVKGNGQLSKLVREFISTVYNKN